MTTLLLIKLRRWLALSGLVVLTGLPLLSAQAQGTRPLIRLDLMNSGTLTDQTHVYFQTGATLGFDPSFDATKLSNPSGLNIASVMGTQQFAINGLPPLNGSALSVLLFVGVPAFGTYRIQVGQFENLTTPAVWLRDTQLNTRTRLALGTTYPLTFTTNYTAVNRLYLEFDAVVSANTPEAEAAVAVYPNPSHGSFSVELPALKSSTVQLRLFDALGRPVLTRILPLSATGATLPVPTTGLAPGLYTLWIEAGRKVLRRSIALE
jgi:hypothetical protein